MVNRYGMKRCVGEEKRREGKGVGDERKIQGGMRKVKEIPPSIAVR